QKASQVRARNSKRLLGWPWSPLRSLSRTCCLFRPSREIGLLASTGRDNAKPSTTLGSYSFHLWKSKLGQTPPSPPSMYVDCADAAGIVFSPSLGGGLFLPCFFFPF